MAMSRFPSATGWKPRPPLPPLNSHQDAWFVFHRHCSHGSSFGLPSQPPPLCNCGWNTESLHEAPRFNDILVTVTNPVMTVGLRHLTSRYLILPAPLLTRTHQLSPPTSRRPYTPRSDSVLPTWRRCSCNRSSRTRSGLSSCRSSTRGMTARSDCRYR
jgi:hypothetical protein